MCIKRFAFRYHDMKRLYISCNKYNRHASGVSFKNPPRIGTNSAAIKTQKAATEAKTADFSFSPEKLHVCNKYPNDTCYEMDTKSDIL